MKYCNKKRTRKNWTNQVTVRYTQEAMDWCRRQPSDGKFFCCGFYDWTFENSNDALVFKLRFGKF